MKHINLSILLYDTDTILHYNNLPHYGLKNLFSFKCLGTMDYISNYFKKGFWTFQGYDFLITFDRLFLLIDRAEFRNI